MTRRTVEQVVEQTLSFARQHMDIVSRLYLILGGVSSWLFLVWLFSGVGVGDLRFGSRIAVSPTQSISHSLEYLGFTDTIVITSMSDWMVNRSDSLTFAAITFAAVSSVSTAALLIHNIHLVGELRGPSTVWICLAVLAQLAPSRPGVPVTSLAIIFFVVTVFSVWKNKTAGAAHTVDYIGALTIAIWMPIVAPIAVTWHALAGPIFKTSKRDTIGKNKLN